MSSVGRGSTLLLNIPPDQRGLFHEKDIKSLRGYKKIIDKEFAVNLARNAKVKPNSYRANSISYSGSNITDGNKETYWATNDDHNSGSLEINLGKVSSVKYIMLQEYIKLGQRVKNLNIEIWKDGRWQKVATATTIGYKRIIRIEPVLTSKIRVNITDSKASPLISNVEIF